MSRKQKRDSRAAGRSTSRPPRRVWRRFWLLGAVVFLAAFGVRLLYLSDLRQSPLFDAPIMDAQVNDSWAWEIAQGSDETDVFFRAPLYPYFLAGIYAVAGHDRAAARVVQLLIGALSCVLIAGIARWLFDSATGYLAGLWAAAYGVLIYFEGELLIPVLAIFCDLLWLGSVLWYAQRPRTRLALLSGALLGLAALARPNILLPGLAILVWMIWRATPDRNLRAALVHAAAFLLAALILISPATLHNRIRGDDWVPIASQGGVNLYIGNHPGADGVWAGLPELGREWQSTYAGAEAYASQTANRPLRPSEVSRFWQDRALRFARTQPGDFLALLWHKLRYFWIAQELPNNTDLYFFADSSPVLRLLIWKRGIFFPFGLVAPLALAGLLLAWRRQPRVRILLLFVLAYMASIVPFFVNSRLRLPIVPILLLLGAHGLVATARALRGGSARRLRGPLVAALAAGILMHTASYNQAPQAAGSSHNKIGIALLQQGRPAEAATEFAKAVSLRPADGQARVNQASALLRLGRAREAIELLKAGLVYTDEIDRIRYCLGLAWQQLGKPERAIEEYRAAVRENPDYLEAQNNLGSLCLASGALDEAREHFQRAAEIAPHSERPWLNLGIVLRQQQAWGAAEAALQEAARRQPQRADPYYHLGHVLRAQERSTEGHDAWRRFLARAAATDPRRDEVQRLLTAEGPAAEPPLEKIE